MFQPYLGLLETGNQWDISKGEKKTLLYLMPIMYLALCEVFDFSVFTDSSHYPCGLVECLDLNIGN